MSAWIKRSSSWDAAPRKPITLPGQKVRTIADEIDALLAADAFDSSAFGPYAARHRCAEAADHLQRIAGATKSLIGAMFARSV